MSWRSWSGEFIERVVAFHVKHCGVDRFAGWLFESVVSSLLVVGGWCFTWNMGNACKRNLLRLRSCFEACFMGWVWRIRINECWIGRRVVI